MPYIEGVYHAPFDRHDPDALHDRQITCAVSNIYDHVLDTEGAIWWWCRNKGIWYQLHEEADVAAREDFAVYRAALRRSIPLLRILIESAFSGERGSAFSALNKLVASINAAFRASSNDGGAVVSVWGLYHGATHGERWLVSDLFPSAYDEAVAADIRSREEAAKEAELLRTVEGLCGPGFADAVECDFDRKDCRALGQRMVLCSTSTNITHALDMNWNVWLWSGKRYGWCRLTDEASELLRMEVVAFQGQAKRALPLIRIFKETEFPGVKDAAYEALWELADAVNEVFSDSGLGGTNTIAPAAFHYGTTGCFGWQFTDVKPPSYDHELSLALHTRDYRRRDEQEARAKAARQKRTAGT